jgi:hypothetical protein
MTRSCRFTISVVVIGLLALQSGISAAKGQNFGKIIAGTYLSIQENGAQILQIQQDGNFSVINSLQFSGGAGNLLFSNSLGSWEQTGDPMITGIAANLNFRSSNGQFVGVANSIYDITFDEEFQTAELTCEGAIYPPGVDPFDPGTEEPIAEFDCGPSALEFHRVPSM